MFNYFLKWLIIFSHRWLINIREANWTFKFDNFSEFPKVSFWRIVYEIDMRPTPKVHKNVFITIAAKLKPPSQPAFTYSKLTMKKSKQCMKLVQSWNVWNWFNKDTRKTSFMTLHCTNCTEGGRGHKSHCFGVFIFNLWTHFKCCLGVSIFDFEQINTSWVITFSLYFFRWKLILPV